MGGHVGKAWVFLGAFFFTAGWYVAWAFIGVKAATVFFVRDLEIPFRYVMI